MYMWSIISFIDEEAIYQKELLRKCSICKQSYLKTDFVKCNKCSSEVCINCTILAGKEGNYCRNCFLNFPDKKKETIAKQASKIKFWAQTGYYIFMALLLVTIITFALLIFDSLFFYVGLLIAAIDFLYGYKLFKFLSEVKP